MTRVLLVRHGESEWNAVGRWQGQADPPLTELGRRQAKDAATAIAARTPVAAVVASDLQRARVTAETIAAEVGAGGVRLDPDLRERHAGEWQGLTRAEIHAQWPGYLSDDQGPPGSRRPAMRHPPSYEPDDLLVARALRGLHVAVDAVSPDDLVVVVTHGGVMHAIEQHLGDDAAWVRIPNLGARWLRVDGTTLVLGERLVLVDPEERTEQPADQL